MKNVTNVHNDMHSPINVRVKIKLGCYQGHQKQMDIGGAGNSKNLGWSGACTPR